MEPADRVGVRSVSGEEEEAVHELRAALRNSRGTHQENQERVSQAWQTLRSVATSSAVQVNSHARRLKVERHGRRIKRKASHEKRQKVADTVKNDGRPLHDAARLGQADRVAELIREGSKVSSKDNAGYSALHWASLYGHVEVVRLLLKSGAGDGKRINRQNHAGNTALHLACLGRHAEVAYMLQVYKPDEYLLNSYEQSPVSLGLRELIGSVQKTRRLDDLRAERSNPYQSLLSEALDWRMETDDRRIGIDYGHVLSEKSADKARFRGRWRSWEEYDSAWVAFAQRSTRTSGAQSLASADNSVLGDRIRFEDVPWPFQASNRGEDFDTGEERSGTERLLLSTIGVTGPQIRRLIQTERLRWHPDKFLQLFGRCLAVEDNNRIQEGVQSVSQLLNSFASKAMS